MAKTIPVETLVKMVNHRNRYSTCSPDNRMGWNSLLETVLHETGNYKGFTYLTENQVPEGQDPGIFFKLVNEVDPQTGEIKYNVPAHEYPDESRREYNT